MFKRVFLTVFAVSLLFCPVLADNCSKCDESIISTDATVNREITPDTAKIRFTVENSGLNLANLKEKNDKIVNDAIGAIKKELNQTESIKTVNFSVRNVYSYKDKVRVFQKYEVQNGFEVKLKDLDKVSKIINLAMEHGVKNVSGVNFIVENSENICNEMMAEAVKIGKNRIQYIANAAGTTIDKLKSINPYCSLSSSHVQSKSFRVNSTNAMMDSVAQGSNSLDTIEAGTINARANVNMVYYLK